MTGLEQFRFMGPHGLPVDIPTALDCLQHGRLEVEGQLIDASNVTLYCKVTHDGRELEAIYKPIRGERPLWDFPDGTLAERERAAYLVSVETGWEIVPPTVLRDGPFGTGMVQLWIDVDEEVDLVTLAQSDDHPGLRRMAIFDAVINNSDRKGGHLLPMPDGHVYGVDHGVTFSIDEKLRTILWQWAGEPLPADSVPVLDRLRERMRGELGEELGELLTQREVAAARRRVERLVRFGEHPEPSGDWPPVPWPPF